MENLTEKIDLYLTGGMTKFEAESFEAEMAESEELKSEVALQAKTYAMLESAAWVKTKSKVEALNRKSSKTLFMRPLLKIASVAIVLLGSSYFFIHQSYSDSNLYAAYATPHPDNLTVMGDDNNELSEAMEYYNEGNYNEADKLFVALSNDEELKDELLVYRFTCLLETNQPQRVIDLIQKMEESKLNSTIQWQLILAHLANGSTDNLTDLIEDFRTSNNGYKEVSSKELLEDLRSFWR
ncbi:MAG: hypothetical protein MK105_10515 [Crocinitomicaceae bacterium]|nr:hypothetical protein [Crocinitomicaceae bacterium]